MAKIFENSCKLVERIPDISTTKLYFRSILDVLHPEDKEKIVEDLLDFVTEEK